MILYTPMPYEAIYADTNDDRKLKEIQIQGVPVMVEMKEDEAEIVQIMSTNPMDFLNQELAPGKRLKLNLGTNQTNAYE
ncbi:YlzJ-like family protein [Bacillus sp. 179-C3.3 HS]|uniref:YlzJ-like family protein n=1 Tax=Bacillus sp. 179-C3.3 HS TaxID=3232162 RepID=UPI00399FED62